MGSFYDSGLAKLHVTLHINNSKRQFSTAIRDDLKLVGAFPQFPLDVPSSDSSCLVENGFRGGSLIRVFANGASDTEHD